VFGPALFLGTMLGSALGQSLEGIHPELTSSVAVYGVAGMGAVISCVIGAPLATILIVFELTGSYALTTAVMIAVVVSHMTVSRLFPFSWFTLQLARRGVDVHSGREVRIMRSRQIHELMSDQVTVTDPGIMATKALQQLLDTDAGELLVVNTEGILLGHVTLASLVRGVGGGDRPVSDFVTMPGIVLQRGDSLDEAMKQLRYFVGASVPVVDDAGSMRLAGVVFQSSVIGAYNDAVAQARAEERGSE
jgi:CIC family chloride channel protein